MEISISHFASSETGLEIRTEHGKVYSTDLFTKSTLDVLVGQEPGDKISKLTVHRGTSREQVESGDLEYSIKKQILALLPQKK